MNITPTSAAMGTASISGARNRMNNNSAIAAVMPESRPRPPDFTLMSDWPIIAHPPMPPKNPVTTLATPWPQPSRVLSEWVSVMSSRSFRA